LHLASHSRFVSKCHRKKECGDQFQSPKSTRPNLFVKSLELGVEKNEETIAEGENK
jgi:hypothetical protein